MKTVNFNTAKTKMHDARGIENPILWSWKQVSGVYYPCVPYAWEVLKDDFSNLEEFEQMIKDKGFFDLWERFQNEVSTGLDYEDLADWLKRLELFGLTFNYGLDAEPFEFKLIHF